MAQRGSACNNMNQPVKAWSIDYIFVDEVPFAAWMRLDTVVHCTKKPFLFIMTHADQRGSMLGTRYVLTLPPSCPRHPFHSCHRVHCDDIMEWLDSMGGGKPWREHPWRGQRGPRDVNKDNKIVFETGQLWLYSTSMESNGEIHAVAVWTRLEQACSTLGHASRTWTKHFHQEERRSLTRWH